MRQGQRRGWTAFVACLAFIVASCAGNSMGTRPETASPDQEQLYSYSDRYVWQGALTGALLGCGIGMLASDNALAGCAVGGVAGAALGAGAGTYIASRQESAAPTQAALNTELGALEAELAKARAAREAAARIVARHETRMQELQAGVQSGAMAVTEAEKELEYMKYDLGQMLKTQEALGKTLEQVKADLEADRGDETYRKTLSDHATALEQEQAALNAEVAQMQAIIEAEAQFMG